MFHLCSPQSLGSSMVRAFGQITEGCGFKSHLELGFIFSEFNDLSIILDFLITHFQLNYAVISLDCKQSLFCCETRVRSSRISQQKRECSQSTVNSRY